MAHGKFVTASLVHSALKCWTAEPEPGNFLERDMMEPTAHVGVVQPSSGASGAGGGAGGDGAVPAETMAAMGPVAAEDEAAAAGAAAGVRALRFPGVAVGVAAAAGVAVAAGAERGRFAPALADAAATAAAISARRAVHVGLGGLLGDERILDVAH